MKILFINDIPFNPQYGGIERVTDSLVRVLINRGHKIFYMCGKVHDYELLNFKFPVPIFTLPNDGLFSSKENVDYYISLIEEYSIDVVINQRGLEPDFNASLISKPGVKFISVVNSMPLAYMYGAIYSYKLPAYGIKNRVKKFIKTIIHSLYKYKKKKNPYKVEQ